MKKYVFLFLCLIGNHAYAKSGSSYGCDLALLDNDEIVSQGEVSEYIFGVRRELDEIKRIDSILNFIYGQNFAYDDYLDFRTCLGTTTSRFISRNKSTFILAVIGRVEITLLNHAERLELWNLVNDIKLSGDKIQMIELVNATKKFRDDKSVEKLLNIYNYYGFDAIIIKREVISALHFIGSDTSFKAIYDIKRENDNKVIDSDINSLFL